MNTDLQHRCHKALKPGNIHAPSPSAVKSNTQATRLPKGPGARRSDPTSCYQLIAPPFGILPRHRGLIGVAADAVTDRRDQEMWMTATWPSSSERRRNAAESAGAAALGLDGFQLLDTSQRHRPAGPRLVPLFAWSQQLHSDRCDVDLAVVSADPPRCRRSCTAPRAPRRRKSMLNSTSASSFPRLPVDARNENRVAGI